jgi:hypothetical protein
MDRDELEALACEAETCAEHYAKAPGHVGPETIIDIYRAIARLARLSGEQK